MIYIFIYFNIFVQFKKYIINAKYNIELLDKAYQFGLILKLFSFNVKYIKYRLENKRIISLYQV